MSYVIQDGILTDDDGVDLSHFEPEYMERLQAFFLHPRIKDRYYVESGARSRAKQTKLYNDYRSGRGPLAAKPCQSDHAYDCPGRPLAKATDLHPLSGRGGSYAELHAVAREYGFYFDIPSEKWHMVMRPGRGPIPSAKTKEKAMTLVIEPQGAVVHPHDDDSGWAFGRRGHVYHFGQAKYHGGWDDQTRNGDRYCVALVPSASGNGYFLVSNRGEVFAYGDAVWTGNYQKEWGDFVIIGAWANRNQPAGGVTMLRDDGKVLNGYALPELPDPPRA